LKESHSSALIKEEEALIVAFGMRCDIVISKVRHTHLAQQWAKCAFATDIS
jgi:hypothetical protein